MKLEHDIRPVLRSFVSMSLSVLSLNSYSLVVDTIKLDKWYVVNTVDSFHNSSDVQAEYTVNISRYGHTKKVSCILPVKTNIDTAIAGRIKAVGIVKRYSGEHYFCIVDKATKMLKISFSDQVFQQLPDKNPLKKPWNKNWKKRNNSKPKFDSTKPYKSVSIPE